MGGKRLPVVSAADAVAKVGDATFSFENSDPRTQPGAHFVERLPALTYEARTINPLERCAGRLKAALHDVFHGLCDERRHCV